MPAKLTPTQRQGIYIGLAILNAALIGAQQVWSMSPVYAQVVGMASLLCAAMMKHFSSDATTAEDATASYKRDML